MNAYLTMSAGLIDTGLINTGLINTGLTIDLPNSKIGMIRGDKICGPSRKRITSEKYFRQAIYIFNEEGKHVDSGFIEINDLSDKCNMIKVFDKTKKYLHLFERWEHCGSQFYKSDNFNITDIVSGNIVGALKENYVSEFARDNKSCFIGDLEKDTYSEMLLECLNEYNSVNAPLAWLKKLENKTCSCNLLEELEINELCLLKNDEINKEKREMLFKSISNSNAMRCVCKIIPLKPKLTEEQKIKRAELKLQAQSEIANVFLRMKTEKETKVEIEEEEL